MKRKVENWRTGELENWRIGEIGGARGLTCIDRGQSNTAKSRTAGNARLSSASSSASHPRGVRQLEQPVQLAPAERAGGRDVFFGHVGTPAVVVELEDQEVAARRLEGAEALASLVFGMDLPRDRPGQMAGVNAQRPGDVAVKGWRGRRLSGLCACGVWIFVHF
jgi:hypothetical protein